MYACDARGVAQTSGGRDHRPPLPHFGTSLDWFKAAETVGWADSSQDRASGGALGLFPSATEIIDRSHPSPKKRGWPPAAPPSLSRSRGLSRSPRRSPPEQPTDTAVAPDLERMSRGTRKLR
jgi:hypothetical protein